MKISLNWLSEYIRTNADQNLLCETLTDIGLEVESDTDLSANQNDLTGIVVGEILSCDKHPDADKLKVTSVDIGEEEPLNIVCGAPNAETGMKVAVATIGTVLKDEKGNGFKIKKSKLRGVYSFGMLCSEKELKIGEDNSGILNLPKELKNGQPISEFYGSVKDILIEIGLTPNRTDAMSHHGVARDLHAALKSRKIETEFNKPNKKELVNKNTNQLNINIEAGEKIVRYMGVKLKNVKVGESPKWLKELLSTIDIKPVNNVVDITNFIIHDLGQPLHAFDWSKIENEKIVVRHAKEKETFITLDNQEIKLSTEDITICNENSPMCLAGVMGGLNSGVTAKTNTILLEAAVFNEISVRKTSKKHNIFSDSSFRFERGVDANFTPIAFNKAILLLKEVTNAEIDSAVFDYYPNVLEREKISFDLIKMKKILGIEIPKVEVISILKDLDFEIIENNESSLELSIPTYRFDVKRQADIVEEILRIYGYNKITVPEKLTSAIPYSFELNKKHQLQKSIASKLIDYGFSEAINVSMESGDCKSFYKDEAIDIYNSLSNELSVLRGSMLPSLLKNVSFNEKRQQNRIALFEFGKIYSTNKETHEKNKLAIVLNGKSEGNWTSKTKTSPFFNMKGILENIFSTNGLKVEQHVVDNEDTGLEFHINGKIIAQIAKVNSETLKVFDVAKETIFTTIDWDYFSKIASKKDAKFKKIAKFPFVKRDLSLEVNESVQFGKLEKSAFEAEKKLLTNVCLFDVYKGENVPKGKKSYTLSFRLEKEDGTLNEKEISKAMSNISSALEKELSATVRSQ